MLLFNANASSMYCWPRWEPTLQDLKAVNKLLADMKFRQRFVAVCVGDTHPDAALFNSFTSKLSGLRWNAVVNFCKDATSPCGQGRTMVFFVHYYNLQ